jgi:hypothetical protein
MIYYSQGMISFLSIQKKFNKFRKNYLRTSKFFYKINKNSEIIDPTIRKIDFRLRKTIPQ